MHLCNDARLLISDYPLSEVVDTGGIALYPTLTVTHCLKMAQIGIVGEFLIIYTQREGRDCLYECGAVELAGIHHKAFVIIHLKSVSHIWYAYEFTCKEKRNVFIVR